jgi:hypothetical protein
MSDTKEAGEKVAKELALQQAKQNGRAFLGGALKMFVVGLAAAAGAAVAIKVTQKDCVCETGNDMASPTSM